MSMEYKNIVSLEGAAKDGLKMLAKNICSEYGAYNIQQKGKKINTAGTQQESRRKYGFIKKI